MFIKWSQDSFSASFRESLVARTSGVCCTSETVALLTMMLFFRKFFTCTFNGTTNSINSK